MRRMKFICCTLLLIDIYIDYQITYDWGGSRNEKYVRTSVLKTSLERTNRMIPENQSSNLFAVVNKFYRPNNRSVNYYPTRLQFSITFHNTNVLNLVAAKRPQEFQTQTEFETRNKFYTRKRCQAALVKHSGYRMEETLITLKFSLQLDNAS